MSLLAAGPILAVLALLPAVCVRRFRDLQRIAREVALKSQVSDRSACLTARYCSFTKRSPPALSLS